MSVRRGILVPLACLLAAAAPTHAAAASAAPYRGLDTWYADGPRIDESAVLSLAGALLSSPLRSAGYDLVWLDAGWWGGARSASGAIAPSRTRWPHGLSWLVRHLHSSGLRVGIYTDLGAKGCGNGGSRGHLQSDINTFAAWGFDAVKADFCGATSFGLDPRREYASVARAIARDHPRRKLMLAVADAALPARRGYPTFAQSALDAHAWAPASASSWRTGPDLGGPGHVRWSDVLRNIELDGTQAGAARPGHWNDPDYLVPGAGLSYEQAKAQLTMWAMLSAPLMLSADPARLAPQTLALFTNVDAIAIDAAPAAAVRLRHQGSVETWTKQLSGGQTAVALLNRGTRSAAARLTAADLGLSPGTPVTARDVWTSHQLQGDRSVTVRVPGDGVVALIAAT